MQKKIYILCLSLSMLFCFSNTDAQSGKSEISGTYGYFSYFTLYKGAPFSTSSGTGVLTYKYYINDNFTLGMGMAFENISDWGSLLSFSPEATFKYMDTKDNQIRVRLYGAVSMGICLFTDWDNNPNHIDGSGLKLWAFQATPFGIRIGRKLACFAEIGLGYKGIISGGLSYRFRTRPKYVPVD